MVRRGVWCDSVQRRSPVAAPQRACRGRTPEMVAAANDVPGVVLAQAGVAPENAPNPNAVYVNSLQFAFPGSPPFIDDFTLELPAGSRCLLCGANGAGAWH
jgi:ABC-type multidrug transport system fused ATPase/permease subunit